MTIISRRTALSGLAGLALMPRNTASQERPAATGSLDIRHYAYKNSLWDHRAGAGSVDTDAASWIHRLLVASGAPDSYHTRSEFSFYDQWSLPPSNGSGNEEAPSLAGTDWAGGWTAMEQVNLLQFTPDNFDSYHVDPDTPNNLDPAESIQDAIVRVIDGWQSAAPSNIGTRTFLLYSAWTNLPGVAGDGSAPTGFTDWTTWEAMTLGSYLSWFDLLLTRLRAERPTLNIIRPRITEAVLKARRDIPALAAVAATEWFEDDVHGRPDWYLLVGACAYMAIYKRKAPASYAAPAGAAINPAITSNWSTIVDHMWAELTALSD